jgi:hypothetical protein
VIELSSDRNVYLQRQSMGAMFQKEWFFAAFFFFGAVGVGIWLALKIKALHDSELKKPPEHSFDPLTVFFAKKFSFLNRTWIQEALKWEKERQERLARRAETEAPKDLQETIARLLKSPDGINTANNLGQTALHIASASGKTEMIDLLLRNGAAINKKDNEGKTALILSAQRNQLGSVIKLLDRGADPNAKDSAGQSAVEYARKNQKEAIVQAITKAASQKPKLHAAIQAGDLSAVSRLAREGADLNMPDAGGVTPLILAVRNDRQGIVRTLLEQGADIELRDSSGKTALEHAQELKNQALITLLMNPPQPEEDEESQEDEGEE